MIAVKGVHFAFDAQGGVHSPAGAHPDFCGVGLRKGIVKIKCR